MLEKWRKAGLVLVIFLIGLGLRWQAAHRLPVDYDEPVYLRAAQHFAAALVEGDWEEIIQYKVNYEHPQLVKLVYAAGLTRIPLSKELEWFPYYDPLSESPRGKELLVARKIAAGLGGLEAAVLAWINPAAGLFLAIHSVTIKYTSVAYLDALPALTSLLSVAAFSRAFPMKLTQKDSQQAEAPRWKWLIFSALMLGLSAASKYLYAVSGLAMLLYALLLVLLRRVHWRKIIPAVLVWGFTAILFFGAANPFLWDDPFGRLERSMRFSFDYANSEAVSVAEYPFWQPLAWLARSVPNQMPTHAMPTLPGAFLIAWDGLIAILAILGLYEMGKRKPIYLVWLLSGLAFLLIWKTKWPQYVVAVTAPFCLSAGYAVYHVWQKALVPLLRKIPFVASAEHAARMNSG